MKPLIVANWKMNPASKKEAQELLWGIKKNTEQVEVVICPPFVYLPLFEGVILGAQDVFFEPKGAYTGEVSAQMLTDLGVKYVLVGHSERRKHFGETDEIVVKKMKAVLAAGLTPIVCIDDEKQIPQEAAGIVIAYEPLFAIGTGNNCPPQDVKKRVDAIRALAQNVRVLYGGSVNSKNAASYLIEGGVDGLLVGGASLDAAEFNAIIQSCQKT